MLLRNELTCLGHIVGDLFDEWVHAAEGQHSAEPAVEFHIDCFAVEIGIEIKEIGFDGDVVLNEGGVVSDADGGAVRDAVHDGAAGVNAGGGEELSGCDIGGGKADGASTFGAGDDLAAQGVGSAEACCDIQDAALFDEPADEAAGDFYDGHVAEDDFARADDDGFKTEGGSFLFQHGDTAFGAAAEIEGGSLDHRGRAEFACDDLPQKILGGHVQEFARRLDGYDCVGGKAFDELQTLIPGRQWRPHDFRLQDGERVRLKRHDDKGNAAGCRFAFSTAEHFAVAEVDAIKITDAENAALCARGEQLPITHNFHVRQYPETFKPWQRIGGETSLYAGATNDYIAEMTEQQPSSSPENATDVPVAGEQTTAGGAENSTETTASPELTADAMPLSQVLEALLFSTDVPLSAGKLAEIVGLDSTKPIKQTIEQLNAGYNDRQAAYRIEERAGGFQLLTLPQYAQYIERLVRKKDEGRLTPASLETLAIVAYRQPLTRASVEVIRGVACGETLRTLMEHNLVKIVGRAEEIGRPMLYGTTRYFLEVFGLANIKDLPKSDALKEPK